MSELLRLLPNPSYDPGGPYPEAARDAIDDDGFELARRVIEGWPGYTPTPLRRLPDLARRCGVAEILLKDEGGRFGLGSFKVVGGAYGVLRALQADLQRRGVDADLEALRRGELADRVAETVIACATDGNHGRAVAWAAGQLGARCEVWVPSIVSAARVRSIEALGARVTRVDGTYDEALRQLAAAAEQAGWIVVSDQSTDGTEPIPRHIMQGYALVAEEVLGALDGDPLPTHVLVQAGVGGFAAAICAHLWLRLGSQRPTFVCVEPLAADCLYRSAAAGVPTPVPGDLETVMACLSCGEVSLLGWRVLSSGAAAFLAIDDEAAIEAMRLLAAGGADQPPVVAGESGAAGVGGLLRVSAEETARRELGLDEGSRVLLFATEGATDPEVYASLVGAAPSEVAGGRTQG